MHRLTKEEIEKIIELPEGCDRFFVPWELLETLSDEEDSEDPDFERAGDRYSMWRKIKQTISCFRQKRK